MTERLGSVSKLILQVLTGFEEKRWTLEQLCSRGSDYCVCLFEAYGFGIWHLFLCV